MSTLGVAVQRGRDSVIAISVSGLDVSLANGTYNTEVGHPRYRLGAAFWGGGVPRYLFVSSAMYAEDYGGVGWSTNTLGGISLSVGYHAWQTSSTYANFQLQDLPPRMTFSAFFARDIRNCPLDPHQTAGFYTAFSTEENIFYNDNATRDWDPNNPNDPHHSYVPQNMDMNNIIVRKTIQVTPTANLASMTVV